MNKDFLDIIETFAYFVLVFAAILILVANL